MNDHKNSPTPAHPHPVLRPPSNLVGFAELPTPGTGVVVSDEDLLESLHRDGQTIGGEKDRKLSPDEILRLWCIGGTVGIILGVLAFAAVIFVLKLAGRI